MIFKPQDRPSWLKARKHGIGGSDAGAAIGVNKYRSNVDVWLEKTGAVEHEDISDNPAVRFGKEAEAHIRALFALEHPEMTVDYHEFYMYYQPERPWLYATLDGVLTDENGRFGILEIKTATINNAIQWREWQEWDEGTKISLQKIPDSYYTQVLHQLAATGWDFAVLFAYIRTPYSDSAKARLIERTIERVEVEADIDYLIQAESKFWQTVESGIRPPLILPSI